MLELTLTVFERVQLTQHEAFAREPILLDIGSPDDRRLRKRLLREFGFDSDEVEAHGIEKEYALPQEGVPAESWPRFTLAMGVEASEDTVSGDELPEGADPSRGIVTGFRWEDNAECRFELEEDEVRLLKSHLDLVFEPDSNGDRRSDDFGFWLVELLEDVDEIIDTLEVKEDE